MVRRRPGRRGPIWGMPNPEDFPPNADLPPGAIPIGTPRPVIDEDHDRTLMQSPHATCASCDYFHPVSEPGQPYGGQCRIGPPDTHLAVIPPEELSSVERQLLNGVQAKPGPQILPVAIWPGVAGDAWCGAHSER